MKVVFRNFLMLVFALSALFFSGCATKRGEVGLQVPITKTDSAPSNGKNIYINTVVDKRFFEIKPPQPNTPSLDPSELQNEAIKARAIGRKRNTYGMALGDILLNEKQTVTSVVKDALKEALMEKGYWILENKVEITPETFIVDVQIIKFWTWMNPGFWAITLSSEIETNLYFKKQNSPDEYNVYVRASDNFQTGMESNYIEVMQTALKKYATDVKEKIK